jgi:hypothetical protein
MKSGDKAILPFPTEFIITFLPSVLRDDVVAVVQKEMSGLAVQWTYDAPTFSGLCFAAENVWSRSARRKRRKLDHDGTDPLGSETSGKKVKTNEPEDTTATSTASSPPATATHTPNTTRQQGAPGNLDPDSHTVAQEPAKDNDEEVRTSAKLGVRITIEAECIRVECLKGRDSVLWESFCGMLKRTVDTIVDNGAGSARREKGDPEHS